MTAVLPHAHLGEGTRVLPAQAGVVAVWIFSLRLGDPLCLWPCLNSTVFYFICLSFSNSRTPTYHFFFSSLPFPSFFCLFFSTLPLAFGM